jgi:hypothetical protein
LDRLFIGRRGRSKKTVNRGSKIVQATSISINY